MFEIWYSLDEIKIIESTYINKKRGVQTRERIDEAYDPELAINRALDTYRKKGYSVKRIQKLERIKKRKFKGKYD